ncbi:MAG: mechanosensitive ion channel family protein [Polyangiaceae bacterium]|nr:mechanosensitive ion channel family protein [Polyangiaceae bacterium]
MTTAELAWSWLAARWGDLVLQLVGAFAVVVIARLTGGALGRVVERATLLRSPSSTALAGWLRRVTRGTVGIVGIVMALDQVGVKVGSLLAGAGLVGVALGFGAQSLVKDVIGGFFLGLEGALAVGDWVKVDPVEGEVEHVGLRVVRVRGLDGRLHYVPHGAIVIVSNASRDWMRAIVNVSVAYEGDVTRALDELRLLASSWAEEHAEIVLEPPEVHGVVGLGDSGITLRVMAKVRPSHQWAAERELRLRIKERFDAAGIEIPFPRQVVYNRGDEAPAARLARSAASAAEPAPVAVEPPKT